MGRTFKGKVPSVLARAASKKTKNGLTVARENLRQSSKLLSFSNFTATWSIDNTLLDVCTI